MIELTLTDALEETLRRMYVESDDFNYAIDTGLYLGNRYANYIIKTIPGVIDALTGLNSQYLSVLIFDSEESMLLFTLRYS